MLRGRPSSSRQSSRRHHNGFAWLVLAVIAHALTHKGFKMLPLPFCLRQATVSVKSFFEKVLSTSRGQGVDPPPALTTGLDVFDRILKVRTPSSPARSHKHAVLSIRLHLRCLHSRHSSLLHLLLWSAPPVQQLWPLEGASSEICMLKC